MSKTQRCSRGVVLAVGAVAIMVCGTWAEAAPVRYDNPAGPAHFVWTGGTGGYPIGLEIISDAASQTGAFGGIGQFHQANELPSNEIVAAGDGGGELQVTGPYGDMLVGVDLGDPIPSGHPWFIFGLIHYPGDPLYLPLGEETYLGVRFPLEAGGDWHHGWIGVVMNRPDPVGPYEVDTFAWGYETEVGVPIAAGVPEPGSLALLAFGAVAALRRRRQLGN